MKAATMKRVGIPTWQLLSLAGNARLDPRTVAAVLAGRGGANSHQQVIDAAARLGLAIDVPPLATDVPACDVPNPTSFRAT